MSKRKKRTKFLSMLFIAVCLIFALAPIYWMLNTSFKTQGEIFQMVPTMYPHHPTLDSYQYLFEKTYFLRSLGNSFIVAFTTAFLSVVIAFPVAYAVTRLRFTGRQFLAKGILVTYLIPAAVMYIPLFMVVSKFHLTDTLWGLLLIYPTFALPYAAWVMIPHIRSVPKALEEAAAIDGCSKFRTMTTIVLPLVMPGVISTFVFSFSMCWGEYLHALVNINTESLKTFPLVISGLIYGDLYPWGQIMAGAVIACIPILLLYMFSSRFVVGGATSGGVKG